MLTVYSKNIFRLSAFFLYTVIVFQIYYAFYKLHLSIFFIFLSKELKKPGDFAIFYKYRSLLSNCALCTDKATVTG